MINFRRHSKISFWRIVLSFLPGFFPAAMLLLGYGPIAQPRLYHQFVDNRFLFNIPHAGDVLSNTAFAVIAILGLGFLSKPGTRDKAFISSSEPLLFRIFFLGILLTAIGSGWYHLNPDNASLFWDRLAMTICFMSLFAIMIAERIRIYLGMLSLGPLLLIGVLSVYWWIWTENTGQGDLRWYLVVQFYPMITIALMLVLLPSPYTKQNYYWIVLLLYVLAKMAELFDEQIFLVTGKLLSGHNLKHLLSSLAAAVILIMLWLRRSKSIAG